MNRIPGLLRPRSVWRLLAGMLLLGALSACGFHIRGATALPFDTLYTNINLNSEFGARLQRAIQANSPGTRLVAQRSQAEVYLHQIEDDESLRQLSLDADGRVDEYELKLTFTFELIDRDGQILLAPTTFESLRALPYNESIVQAKESEMDRNFQDMRDLLIYRILNRISAPDVRQAYLSSHDVSNASTTQPTPLRPSPSRLTHEPGVR